MVKLVFVRHGHVEGLKPERFRGRWDLALTELGRRQAEAVAKRLAPERPAIIYTGPLQRARDTGEAIARACGLACQTLNDLNDIDYGDWQGRTHTEIRSEAAQDYSTWVTAPHPMRFPSGEALQDVVARSANALRHAIGSDRAPTVVFVSHDSVGRALLLQALDQPLSAYWRLELSPASVSEIIVAGAETRVISVNDTAHLREPELHA